MNALVPDLSPAPSADAASGDWVDRLTQANAWRGQCLHHLTVVEQAVTETLLALRQAPGGDKVRLQHLVGQRLDDLAEALAPDGAFPAFTKAAASLAAFREDHATFRNQLVHGRLAVLVDKHGKTVVTLRLLGFRAQKAERSDLVLTGQEMAERLDQLKRHAGRFCAQLGQVRALAVAGGREVNRGDGGSSPLPHP